jgi:glutathione synthase/RimK-type ligase-like ATP-grasp enzyme
VLLATASGSWELDRDADALVTALRRVDVDAAPAVWDDPDVDWAAADLVVVRSTWDYTWRLEEFLSWASAVAGVSDLANPPRVLRWTTDKRYLADLADAGVPVVPGEFLSVGAEHAAETVRSQLAGASSGEVVVKPTVSAGSKDTLRVGADDAEEGVALAERLLADGRDVVVQPYLSSVDATGETGVVVFGGRCSHAFTKAPILRRGTGLVDGPFAPERISPSTADAAQLGVVDAALEVARQVARADGEDRPLLYARVDLIADDTGSPVVLELELCEPSFFVEVDDDAAGRFASAVRDRLGQAGVATSRNSTVP